MMSQQINPKNLPKLSQLKRLLATETDRTEILRWKEMYVSAAASARKRYDEMRRDCAATGHYEDHHEFERMEAAKNILGRASQAIQLRLSELKKMSRDKYEEDSRRKVIERIAEAHFKVYSGMLHPEIERTFLPREEALKMAFDDAEAFIAERDRRREDGADL